MKKIMVLLLATTMLFASIGCSNGNGGSESVVTKDDYLGTWTGTMGPEPVSITLNTDGSCVAYYSSQGFADEDSNWTFTNPGVKVNVSGGGSLSGKLENGKLVVNYMGQNISLSKVDTSAYVGTWTGTMGDDVSLSVTLNADGTVSAYNSGEGKTTGLWTVTNSGFIMWLDIEDECPEFGLDGNLQNGNLVVNYDGQNISLTKE
jgi:hypothetical protein